MPVLKMRIFKDNLKSIQVISKSQNDFIFKTTFTQKPLKQEGVHIRLIKGFQS